MTFRQKRSSGGYSLRRKVAKKKLDEDFEYNFSKETQCRKSINTSLNNVACDKNLKETMEIKRLITKKQRGRPRKLQVECNVVSASLGISSLNSTLMNSKENKSNSTILYIEPPNESVYATVNAICEVDQQDTMSISHEEVVGDTEDLIWKKIEVDSFKVVSGEDEGSSEEEEVERQEKGNLPESDADTKNDIAVELTVPESHAISSSHNGIKGNTTKVLRKGSEFVKLEDDVQDFKHMISDHKIECSECHKLLKPSSYRQHLRTHTGEKPFGCSLCVARFTRKGDVERHIRIVHNKQKPFKCHRCQRGFGDKKNLRWHLMNHDKKLFYICETCGFKFGKREYWENHVRFIHPVSGMLDSNKIQECCEEKVHQQINTSTIDTKSNTEKTFGTSNTSQAVETAILSIQDNNGTNLPVNQNLPKYANLNNVDFCNYIKFEEFEPTRYEDGRGMTDHVVIELNQEENQQLGMNASQSYKNVTELVDSNRILHIQQPQNICKNQDFPIVIETHEFPVTSSSSGNQIESAVVEADITKVRHIITGILLGESGTVSTDNSERTVVHNFLNAFIDMSNSNNDDSDM